MSRKDFLGGNFQGRAGVGWIAALEVAAAEPDLGGIGVGTDTQASERDGERFVPRSMNDSGHDRPIP